ncbi:reverse transcriptase domain-containing protein [Tanacetum coccineum]
MKVWADKLDDALWAFRIAYKAPIGSTPFRIVYGKACHLPLEMGHKAYWALKKINLDLEAAGKHSNLNLHTLLAPPQSHIHLLNIEVVILIVEDNVDILKK